MDMRNMPKLPSSVSSNKKQPPPPPPPEHKYTEDEKKTVAELKKLYMETIKLDVDLQRGIYNMEKSFETKHNEIYDKRCKILEEFKKKKSHSGDVNPEDGSISNFWLKVLKASYTEFISKKDEKMLMYLTDIRTKLYNEPIVKFVIEFYFDVNPFFSNRIITKTYFLNCLPSVEDPLTYDGAEIYKCEGCNIEWKPNVREEKKKEAPKPGQYIFSTFSSFFDFFNPPILPDKTDDPHYCDINAVLQNDFELGFYLKERVIPKAIMFFTGEIADCHPSGSSEESEDDEEEDEDDEEGSSSNDAM